MSQRPGASAARRARRDRKGMTLVELLVAMILLGVGLLALAGLSLVLNAQARSARLQQVASMAVQSRIDSLSSIRCQALAPSGTQSGIAVANGITERWQVTDGNDVKMIRDSVTFKPRKNALVYLSIIPCRD